MSEGTCSPPWTVIGPMAWSVVSSASRSAARAAMNECLPVVLIARESGGVQVVREEFVDQEDGDLGVATPSFSESASCGVEELEAQGPWCGDPDLR